MAADSRRTKRRARKSMSTTSSSQIIDPHTLAWWTRSLREASQWSQEALAEASGLTVRTIQRIEAGEPSSISTRRSLARGFGYDNVDTFIDPKFALDLNAMLKEIERIGKQAVDEHYSDFIRLSAQRIRTGEQIGRLAENTNSYMFHYHENIPEAAKDAAAALFDYIKDYKDVSDLYSEADKLTTYREIGHLLHELKINNASVHYALRSMKVTGKDWVDQTPIQVDILYLTIDTAKKDIKEIMTAKRVTLGF